MIELIIGGIINALEIIGIQEAGKTTYFYGIFNWLEKKLPGWLWSPIGGCHKCMASVHGILFYIFVLGRYDPIGLLFYIPMLSAISILLKRWGSLK